MNFTDVQIRHFLELALIEAEKALTEGGYPVGSLVVDEGGKIISQHRNQYKISNNVASHPEMLNLADIGIPSGRDLTLFSSLEPCFGCSFFIARSDIRTIYSALKDPHKGGMSDLKSKKEFAHFFHDISLVNGPFDDLKQKSKGLMRAYFMQIGRPDKAKYYS